MPRKPTSPAFNVGLLIVLHLLIVVPLAYALNIWADEASTLYSTQHGLFEAFQNAGANEKQAPLYFWVMALLRNVNASIFFARIFSVICSAVSIKLFADLARRIFDTRAALLLTAFFALHPFLIWASLEIRVYALVILISIGLISLFYSTFIDEGEPSTLKYVGFTILAAIGLYTNYYLAFPLAGMFVALVVTKRWKKGVILAAIGAIAFSVFIPALLAARSQLAANTGGYQEPRLLLEGIRTLWHHFLTFILPAGVFADGDVGAPIIIRVWAVRIGIVVLALFAIKNRRVLSERSLILAIIAAVCFVSLLGMYFVLGERYLEIRHATVLFVPLVLAAGSIIADVFGGEKESISKTFTFVGGLLVLASFAYSLTVLYPNSTKRGDWARIGQYIEDNEKAGQPIVVFTAFDAMALPYHYHGVNNIVPDHGYFEYDLEAEFGTSDSLKNQTDFVVSQIPPEADHIWLAVSEKCTTTAACEPLDNFIHAHYTVELEQPFYLEKLYLLRRNTP